MKNKLSLKSTIINKTKKSNLRLLFIINVHLLTGCVATPADIQRNDNQEIMIPDYSPNPQDTYNDRDIVIEIDMDTNMDIDMDMNMNMDMDMNMNMDINMNMDMAVQPPILECDIPQGGQCVGEILESCQEDRVVQVDCAAQGMLCISDGEGARCEVQQEIDRCANNYCNDNGWCEEGICICDPGYTGANCDSCAVDWQINEFDFCEPLVRLYGTAEDDTILGGDPGEIIRGREGDDTLKGFGGDDYLNGNAGDDYLNGNEGNDSVHGGSGDDDVRGGQGADVIFGGGGDDQLTGGGGNDRLIGGEGDDDLYGAMGDDRYLLDGLGDDWIFDDEGLNTARCGRGVEVESRELIDPDFGMYVLYFRSGGSLTYYQEELLSILGCNIAL